MEAEGASCLSNEVGQGTVLRGMVEAEVAAGTSGETGRTVALADPTARTSALFERLAIDPMPDFP